MKILFSSKITVSTSILNLLPLFLYIKDTKMFRRSTLLMGMFMLFGSNQIMSQIIELNEELSIIADNISYHEDTTETIRKSTYLIAVFNDSLQIILDDDKGYLQTYDTFIAPLNMLKKINHSCLNIMNKLSCSFTLQSYKGLKCIEKRSNAQFGVPRKVIGISFVSFNLNNVEDTSSINKLDEIIKEINVDKSWIDSHCGMLDTFLLTDSTSFIGYKNKYVTEPLLYNDAKLSVISINDVFSDVLGGKFAEKRFDNFDLTLTVDTKGEIIDIFYPSFLFWQKQLSEMGDSPEIPDHVKVMFNYISAEEVELLQEAINKLTLTPAKCNNEFVPVIFSMTLRDQFK